MIESTPPRHQYFITKRGVLISCLDFSLLRQAGASHLTRCDERVSVSCVLPFIITKSANVLVSSTATSRNFHLAHPLFYHRDEQKFPSRALQRAGRCRLVRLEPVFVYRAWLCHQQLDRRPRAARVLTSSSCWPSHDSISKERLSSCTLRCRRGKNRVGQNDLSAAVVITE